MSPRRVAVGCVAALALAALPPQVAADTGEASLELLHGLTDETSLTRDLYREPHATLTAAAYALVDGERTGTVGVSAAFAWEIPLCRLVDASVDGGAALIDGRPTLAGVARVGVCLPTPLMTPQVALITEREVRRSLLDVRRAGVRETGAGVEVGFRGLRWQRARGAIDVQTFALRYHHTRGEGETRPGVTEVALTGEMIAWTRVGDGHDGRDARWRLFAYDIRLAATDGAAASTMIADVPLVAIQDVRVGSLGLSAGVGVTTAHVSTPDQTGVSSMGVAYGAALEGPAGPVSLRAHVGHVNEPWFADAMMIGTRVGVDAAWTRGPLSLRLESVARSLRLAQATAASPRRTTLGVAVDGRRTLGHRAELFGRAELAHTLVPEPAIRGAMHGVAQATVGVALRAGRRW